MVFFKGGGVSVERVLTVRLPGGGVGHDPLGGFGGMVARHLKGTNLRTKGRFMRTRKDEVSGSSAMKAKTRKISVPAPIPPHSFCFFAGKPFLSPLSIPRQILGVPHVYFVYTTK